MAAGTLAIGATAVPMPARHRAAGWLISDQGVAIVRVDRPGVVSRLLVDVGDRISAGQPLIQVASSLRDDLGQDVGRTTEETYQRQLEASESERTLILRDYEDTRASFRSSVARKEGSLETLREQRILQLERVQIAESIIERMKQLVAQGYGSAVELDRRREAVIGARQQLAELDLRTEGVKGEIEELVEKLQALTGERDAKLNDWSMRQASLRREAATSRTAGGRIVSPVGGVVSRLEVSVGETLEPGATIGTVVAGRGNLGATVLISNDAAGQIKVGDRVRVSVNAFPSNRYGTFAGVVTSLARDAASYGPQTNAYQKPAIKAQIRIDLRSNQRIPPGQLRLGMEVFVDIVSGQRTLLERALSR